MTVDSLGGRKPVLAQRWERLYDDLVLEILSLKKKMFHYSEMAKKYRVSIWEIESLSIQLELNGLGQRNGRAFYVRKVGLVDYGSAVRLRENLEASAAEDAAGQVPSDRIAPIRRELKAVSSDDPPWCVNEQVHELIIEFCGQPAAVGKLLRQARYTMSLFPPDEYASQRISPRWSEEIAQEHLAILEALEHGRKVEIRDMIRQHVQGDAWAKLARYVD